MMIDYERRDRETPAAQSQQSSAAWKQHYGNTGATLPGFNKEQTDLHLVRAWATRYKVQ